MINFLCCNGFISAINSYHIRDWCLRAERVYRTHVPPGLVVGNRDLFKERILLGYVVTVIVAEFCGPCVFF
jgi:hypothetical protein